MKTLLMGCGCLTLLLVLGLGGAGWLSWKAMQDMPADAKLEVLFPANRSLIERIDGIIAASEHVDDLGKRLAAGIDEAKVLYLHLTDRDTGWNQDAIKRLAWDGHSVTTVNGAGWGTLTTKFEPRPIRIIESHAQTRNGHEITYTLYLDHPAKVEK